MTDSYRPTTGYVGERMNGTDLTHRIREHIHFLLTTYPGINRTQLSIGTINQSYGKHWRGVLLAMVRTGEVMIKAHHATNPATGRNQRFIHLFSNRDKKTNFDNYPNDEEVTAEMIALDEMRSG
jgi:hypothetical protein